jgi:hypothetical protein
MSQSKYNSPYWKWLESSASPAVRYELEQMEKSKRRGFVSSREVIVRKYGLLKTK